MIAVIAGSGSLPVEACKALGARHERFFVLALFPELNGTQLASVAPDVVNSFFFKAGEILNILQQRGTTKVLFVGKVDKQLLLKNFKLDWLAIKLLASVVYRSDHALMQRLVDELATHGIEVINQETVLTNLKVSPGILCGHLTPELQASIDLGMQTAQLIARSDIGQTVIVKDRMILAIEAIEGTDACITRGIELGGGDVVICKSAFHQHNSQYDLPTIGEGTLSHIKPGQVKVLAWQSSHTLILNLPRCMQIAREKNITLVAV